MISWGQSPALVAIFTIIGAFAIAFLLLFVMPAIQRLSMLNAAHRRLSNDELRGPQDLASVFDGMGVLQHLWSEFRETLHEERSLNPQTGLQEIVRLRATAPASLFFTDSTVVDTPVRAEFFKHLPGILTGIGIIGTFYGLIHGIQGFDATGTNAEVKAGLKELLESVWHAFLVSAAAITLAMVVTFVEKVLLVRLYRKLEELNQAIDEHYKAGVGEEYLSRLVDASEESAAQTRILKDALVEDIRSLLTELTDRQIAATASSHSQLGQQIATSFGQELRDPLAKIASAVGQVSRDQGSAVQSLLTDVLASFSARMESMFGSQLSGISDLQQQTVSALKATVQQLESLSTSMASAGQSATEMMAAQVAEAMRKLEARQAVMNDQMRNFLQEIKETVSQSQSQSAEHMAKLLGDLSASAGALVGDLSARSQQHMAQMGGHVEAVTGSVVEATQKIADAINRLESVTTTSIGLMNSGAETLAIAAADFAKAGNGVSGVLSKSEGLTRQLTQAAGAVGVATQSLDGVLKDYQATRDAVKEMMESVRGSVEAAKREASLTTDVLQRLESSTGKLTIAQRNADEYLSKITTVLDKAHTSFAENVERTLRVANTGFYESLTRATSLLREAIEDLDHALGPLTPSKK